MADFVLDTATDITVGDGGGFESGFAAETGPLAASASIIGDRSGKGNGNGKGDSKGGDDVRKRRPRPKTLKRRLQNRMAQRRYRERQARMVAELRNLAAESAIVHENGSGDEDLMDRDDLELAAAAGTSRCATSSADHPVASSTACCDGEGGGDESQNIWEEIEDGVQARDSQDAGGGGENMVEGGLDLEFSRYFIPEIERVFDGMGASPWESCVQDSQQPSLSQEASRTYQLTSTTHQDRKGNNLSISERWRGGYFPEGDEIAGSSGDWNESMGLVQPDLESDPSPRRIRLHSMFEKSRLVSTGPKRNYEAGNSTPLVFDTLDSHPLPQHQAPPQKLQPSSLPSTTHTLSPNIRLIRIPTRDAYLANALAINLPIPSLYLPSSQSPFYRPRRPSPSRRHRSSSNSRSSSPPSSSTQDLRASIAHLSATIPEHLRPTPPQVLCPHHPYLDLLPFPILRARAVALAARRPPLIDAARLKQDLMDGGLICWSTTTAAAASSSATATATATGGGGEGRASWDVRNWEATPWFLERWGALVGGRDGEIWRQSRWWRGFRGEYEEGEGDGEERAR